MIRTQIQLTEEQARLLREHARANNESIASVIRTAVDHFLMSRKPDRFALYRQALETVGKYKAGIHDISVEHDRYLDEAFKS